MVSLTLKFWRRVHQIAERRVCDRYLDEMFHDRKCPNCQRWGAVGGFDWANVRRIDPMHDGLTCTACGHESIWFMGGMMPDPVSTPPTRSTLTQGDGE